MHRWKKPVAIREVWAENLAHELSIIQQTIVLYRYVSMDTEFPGTIFRPNLEKHELSRLRPADNYSVMKKNVDALKLIQLGLTLSDAYGNLPDFGTDHSYIWQFNFKDFNIESDPQNADSIALLIKQGIDFQKNTEHGIDSEVFARMFLNSGLVLNFFPFKVTWITFHSSYDFGFLLKILTRRTLPNDLNMFMTMMSMYFGGAVYDMKHVMRYCGLHGGLERVAKTLNVDRTAGKSHQAGSDSLLTMQAFMKMKDLYFNGGEGEREILKFKCVLYGLEVVLARFCFIPSSGFGKFGFFRT